jgi:hypothetical protein
MTDEIKTDEPERNIQKIWFKNAQIQWDANKYEDEHAAIGEVLKKLLGRERDRINEAKKYLGQKTYRKNDPDGDIFVSCDDDWSLHVLEL